MKMRMAVICLFALSFFFSCDGSDSTPAAAAVSVTNNSSSTVIVYWAWEDGDKDVHQQSVTLGSGASDSICIQLSVFSDGAFSAKNAAGGYHTYDVVNAGTALLPVSIIDGDFTL